MRILVTLRLRVSSEIAFALNQSPVVVKQLYVPRSKLIAVCYFRGNIDLNVASRIDYRSPMTTKLFKRP
jgi:hypothetical protein